MATVSITYLYALLSEKVGKETAASLTDYVESKVKNELKVQTTTLATKEDLAKAEFKLTECMGNNKAEMIK